MLRPVALCLALAACATTRAPVAPAAAPSPAAPAATPAPAAPETAWAETPRPRSDDARQCLAAAQEQLQRDAFDDAAATLTQCLARCPDDPLVRMRAAQLAAEDGHPDDAVRLLREGLRQTPDDADLLTFAGGVRLRQALDGPTVERRRGAVTSTPSRDAGAEAARARAWLTEAKSLFEEALARRGNHLGAMEGAALTAGRLGEHAEAVRRWQRAADLTDDLDVDERLAAAVAASGDRARATTLYEALVRAEPARGSAQVALAELYEAAGRAGEARSARARGVFHAWVPPFEVPATDENVQAVAALAPWFEEQRPDGAEARARETLTRLAATRTADARALLAAFAWHHSHDALETLAWESLRAHGDDARDTLFDVLARARSFATMRAAAESLARLRDPRLFDVLARALPRDTGVIALDAANALDLLGDARAVPLLAELAAREPQGSDAMQRAGAAAARSRAVLALGAFDTPASRAALARALAAPDTALEAHAALYRLTRDRAHLAALERAAPAQRRAADTLLAHYIERANTPAATAAAQRARRSLEAAPR